MIDEQGGAAGQVLAAAGARIEPARCLVLEQLGVGSESSSLDGVLPLSDSAQQVLEWAARAASMAQITEIGSEHLLVGLMRVRDERVLAILAKLAVDPDFVRTEAKRRLIPGFAPDAPQHGLGRVGGFVTSVSVSRWLPERPPAIPARRHSESVANHASEIGGS
jgi:ATP-dependent Clp protease ATP-binding subunit ClpA